MEAERDISIQELSIKYEEAASKLDEEWQQESMQNRFNKPSPALISMRQHVKALMTAHLFHDAQELANAMTRQEEAEARVAGEKMAAAYKAAHVRLRKKYEAAMQTVYLSADSKRNAALAAEESDLHPIQQRLESLRKMKDNAELARRARSRTKRATVRKSAPVVRTKQLRLNAKLVLPPLKGPKRPPLEEGMSVT